MKALSKPPAVKGPTPQPSDWVAGRRKVSPHGKEKGPRWRRFANAEYAVAQISLGPTGDPCRRGSRRERWIHEIKFDGYRLLGFLAGGEIALRTRNGLDWTAKFPSVTAAIGRLKAEDGSRPRIRTCFV